MNKTIIAAAFALSTIGAAFSASAAAPVAQHRQMAAPPAPPPVEQPYPVYHDSPTASFFSKPMSAVPCHFTEAFVEGRMRQVEICN